ncbi:type I 3-dehydroquinate dehydratase [Treponema sp.]|uniref:type I 3-dehydroquinate dehydratase n=1 Tax=Treponema sp. TaxID=166 RepID=UPI001D99BD2C|nr:type I 3-dehydroquinate dehydratase [Treponema sp.]MBS7242207.1 type I 3-dehydroquinate dehydratase [Treponema sp.]MCI6443126.1 type I 3-dehydroquinate dehydratase [Spirochaetia bacterium]MDY4133267.1 type I 3-dehydroquinate dehydratase [Treponema sp.]
MERPKICLTLTGTTIRENLETLDKYRDKIDMAELRVDYLNTDERLYVRRFPSLIDVPCILTIRRQIDGGKFVEGEAARTVLFARALSFADEDKTRNFAYVDFEEDFHIPSLEDATLAFDTKVIRSFHDMHNPVSDIIGRLKKMTTSGFEIPKIAFMPHSLDDVTNLFREASKLRDNNHILLAMGPMGIPSRILGAKLKNFLTYTSSPESIGNTANIAHLDAVKLNELYRMKTINENTKIFGITGWPLTGTSSPELHNAGYTRHNMNSVYIPFPAENFDQAMSFAETVGVQGFSITVPHKEAVLEKANFISPEVLDIGASNTMVLKDDKWSCYNTDADGFARSLLEFTELKNLKHKKVAIIGAGGAAKAIAYAVYKAGGKACVFNRTLGKAKALAEKYDFEYGPLSAEGGKLLRKYSDIIIQTTSKGMHCKESSNAENDPLFFYEFSGKEILFDIIYMPEVTPVMARAKAAGCHVCNGYYMLRYQGYKQFELFTGDEY